MGKSIRLRPDLSDAHRAFAGAAIRRSDPNALALEADQIIQQQPESADGYLLRAVAEIDRKQFAARRGLHQAFDSTSLEQRGRLRATR